MLHSKYGCVNFSSERGGNSRVGVPCSPLGTAVEREGITLDDLKYYLELIKVDAVADAAVHVLVSETGLGLAVEGLGFRVDG